MNNHLKKNEFREQGMLLNVTVLRSACIGKKLEDNLFESIRKCQKWRPFLALGFGFLFANHQASVARTHKSSMMAKTRSNIMSLQNGYDTSDS